MAPLYGAEREPGTDDSSIPGVPPQEELIERDLDDRDRRWLTMIVGVEPMRLEEEKRLRQQREQIGEDIAA
jgi:hypothetical protein